jgi:hypothetical protein
MVQYRAPMFHTNYYVCNKFQYKASNHIVSHLSSIGCWPYLVQQCIFGVQTNFDISQVRSTITMSDTTLDARLKQAIHNFETTQQDSNIEWLQHEVLACKGLDPDLDALDKRSDELKICTKHTFWSWRVTYLILLEKRKEELAKDLKFATWDALASYHNLV